MAELELLPIPTRILTNKDDIVEAILASQIFKSLYPSRWIYGICVWYASGYG